MARRSRGWVGNVLVWLSHNDSTSSVSIKGFSLGIDSSVFQSDWVTFIHKSKKILCGALVVGRFVLWSFVLVHPK